MANLIIYGGTFDPIHNGHLKTATNVQQHFHFDNFYFLPCKTPVLKKATQASSKHRLKMLQLAIEEQPSDLHFHLDYSEINRESPSFMVTTLTHFREKLGADFSLTLLLGYDTFCQLPLWFEWEKLLQLTNLLVITRHEFSNLQLPEVLQFKLRSNENNDKSKLLRQSHGFIHCFDAGHFDISATKIRALAAQHESLAGLLPESVMAYIKKHSLYETRQRP